MTFFHELLVLHKGGAKFKALVTGSLGSLETCFLEHTMTKVLFFFPNAARGIRMIKLYPLKNLHWWGCEGCAYLLDKNKYPSHLVGKGVRCFSQRCCKGHAEEQLFGKQTLPLHFGSEVLQLWLHSVCFFTTSTHMSWARGRCSPNLKPGAGPLCPKTWGTKSNKRTDRRDCRSEAKLLSLPRLLRKRGLKPHILPLAQPAASQTCTERSSSKICYRAIKICGLLLV